MIDIKINSAFEKKLKKFVSRRPEYKGIICDKIKLLSTNPNARELENHKLSGELKGQRAFPFQKITESLLSRSKKMYIFC